MHGSFGAAPPSLSPPPSLSLAAAVAGVGSALDAAQSVDLAAATGAELADAVVEVARLRARLDALDAALLSRFTSRGDWATEARGRVKLFV